MMRKQLMMKWLMFFLLILVGKSAWATHQRAGEISYTYISGLTYEFTITTYTYTPSLADRPEIEIFWGDGTSSTVARTEKTDLENQISKNVYVTQHTFSGSGLFTVSFEDPNRNAGIVNIPGSVEIPFYIETVININPFLGGNSSPQLMNPPIDNGCTGVIYYHNPGAFDPDGDSLSYSLITCAGYDGEPIPGYSMPNASNSITIDPVTGDLIWDCPTMAGEYNIAILITEWRNGKVISKMVRDMQISIAACNNEPPEIFVEDTCVLAGTSLDLLVKVKDETSTMATLSATGEPFYVKDSPAKFKTIKDSVPYATHFIWNTICDHVKKDPYKVLFKAQDNGPQVELVSFKTLTIQVIAPEPENLSAEPMGNEVHLTWSPDSCPNAVGYDVYRRDGSNPFEPGYCETGMPEDAGYYWIGKTEAWEDTSFIDDGSERPLNHGNEYCYRVVALFPDGAESYVSDEVCTHIANDAPLIINADVITTDAEHGTLKVRWLPAPEIDTVAFKKPYYYDLYRKSSQENAFVKISERPIAFAEDTLEFLDHNLNTLDLDYTYYLDFYAVPEDTAVHIENSDRATSIYLKIAATDRQLQLSWNDQQPWDNVEYVVYRYNDAYHQWDSIAATLETNYADAHLANGQTYCYYVCAHGYYWLPDTVGTLFNKSQQTCGQPTDDTPPEMPDVEISTDCQAVYIRWNFSSDSAASDAYVYYIYYKPTLEGTFVCIDSFYRQDAPCYPEPCEYQLPNTDVIVGCFAIAVADTNHNMTELSDSTCIDIYDCLDYHFPNVFTPNGDQYNDEFVPFSPYHGVVKIAMKIYDRWGRRVFSTEDPAVRWDGLDENSHQPCSDGVYFYSCDVFVNTLAGEISYQLNGSVTLIR